MGITSPYPRENIIAGNCILADMQAYLDKNHRQQNKEILIKHSLGIGECFFVFKYSINQKIKIFHQGAVKMPLSVSFYVRVFLTGKNKNLLHQQEQEDGKSYSSIHTIRGVLRPAFQMAVDDDILVKNPFGFQLAGVLVNDAVAREAIYKDQMPEQGYCQSQRMWHRCFRQSSRTGMLPKWRKL